LINLIRNENMKIYFRWRTWILAALLVIIVFLASDFRLAMVERIAGSWEWTYQNQLEAAQVRLETGGLSAEERQRLEADVKLHSYALEHQIPPKNATLWGGVESMAGAIMVVTLFAVMIAGDIVSSEFSWGTIKLLLIRPANRTKILLSKYIAALLFALFLLALLFLFAFLFNGLLIGFSGVTVPHLSMNESGELVTGSMLLQVLKEYGYGFVELLLTVTMTFMISTVFRSSSLAIGLSIFMMFTGKTIAVLLLRWEWGKYFLFANIDLSRFIEGRPIRPDMSLSFAVSVLIGYFVVFNLLSWYIFKKRDVAA
jgi:ABC-2 type transport system permease protein